MASTFTHCGSQGLKAVCNIWANFCSLDPSQLLVSRCLHLGIAPARRGWIFTLCLWALPQEVPVLCSSCSAIFDPSLTIPYEITKVVFSIFLWNTTLLSLALSTLQAALRPALLLRHHTNISTMLRYQSQLRIKLISLGLELCFDLSEWSWAATGQHGQCLWHTPRLTAPCGGVLSNSTALPGLVPSLSLVSALKKKTDVLALGNDRTENPANFQCLPRINVSLTEIFFPLDLP